MEKNYNDWEKGEWIDKQFHIELEMILQKYVKSKDEEVYKNLHDIIYSYLRSHRWVIY